MFGRECRGLMMDCLMLASCACVRSCGLHSRKRAHHHTALCGCYRVDYRRAKYPMLLSARTFAVAVMPIRPPDGPLASGCDSPGRVGSCMGLFLEGWSGGG